MTDEDAKHPESTPEIFAADDSLSSEFGPEEGLYRVWIAPTCRSEHPSAHIPTFIYISAITEAEAHLKCGLLGVDLHGIECPCQITVEEVELYV